jgi:hypothetical protein
MSSRIATPTQKTAAWTPAPAGGLVLQRQCACGQHTHGSECEQCKKKQMNLQRKSENVGAPDAVPAMVHDVLRSPGQPLDHATRAFFEPRFAHDFSNVRIHHDARAAQSARMVNARAYTAGSNIVFESGQYNPHSHPGRQLLAHELTHVVQQGSGKVGSRNAGEDVTLGDPGDAWERQAELASHNLGDSRLDTLGTPGGSLRVQRAPAGTGDTSASGTTTPANAQPATAPQTQPAAAPVRPQNPQPIENFVYQSTDAVGTFDAALDRSACLLTITKKLKFDFIDNPPVQSWGTGFGPWPQGKAEEFQRTFLQQVAEQWSGQHTLVPENPCAAESCPSVRVAVRAVAVQSGEQTSLTIGYLSGNTPPPPMGVAQSGQTGRLHSGETQPRTVDGSTQLAGVHEFGHMLGLSHSNIAHCGSNHNDPHCYDPYDIMGKGSVVSENDYAPFAAVLGRFNSCSWKAVSEPGALEKFFLKSPVGRFLGLTAAGTALGAGIGAAAGHAGLGTLIGLGAGAAAGLITDLVA